MIFNSCVVFCCKDVPKRTNPACAVLKTSLVPSACRTWTTHFAQLAQAEPAACPRVERQPAKWAGPRASHQAGKASTRSTVCAARNPDVVSSWPVAKLSSHPGPCDSRAPDATAPITLCCPVIHLQHLLRQYSVGY